MVDRYKRLVIEKMIRETHDTGSFVLRPEDANISAVSGQFLTFLFESFAGHEIRRSYSLSSSPELNEPLAVTIKRVPNGEISRLLLERYKEGDVLNTIGASGFFVLPDDPASFHTYMFFAAGSGIVPIFPMIKTLLHLHPSVKVVLIYSNRNSGDTIFYSQLKHLQQQFAENFELHFLYSLSPDLSQSRLTPALLENYVSRYSSHFKEMLFYLCGPNDYMRMILFTLSIFGVPQTHIRREIFNVQQPSAMQVPPDTNEHQVQILAGNEAYNLRVQYPQTILKAARSHGIELSFSCETGQCGTCVAKCLQGTVWMSRNEILLDEDLQKGKVLTCTGYPVHGDVIIKI